MRRYMLPIILFLTDMVAICISIWLASIIRFMDTGNSHISYISSLAVYMPVYVLCHALCFYLFKLYNRIWKYAGIKEMLSIVGANVCGMGLFLVLPVCSSRFWEDIFSCPKPLWSCAVSSTWAL